VTKVSTQVTAGSLAVLTGAGAVIGTVDAANTEPVDPMPPDSAHHRSIGRIPTMEESLAQGGLRLVDVPPALTMLEMRAQPVASAAEELRVPRERLKVGMGERAPREEVRALQEVLQKLGFLPKKAKANGVFGPRLKRAVMVLQDTLQIMGRSTETNGVYGKKTWRSLADLFETKRGKKALQHAHAQLRKYTSYAPGLHFPAHSKRAKDLFLAAARVAGLPESWARSKGLHNILERESDGKVGIPNYTYGSRRNTIRGWKAIHRELRAGRITAVSSATGLGQLLSYNVETYYPKGVKGIGVPLQEAIGMLRYIKARYGNPENAWARYNTVHEGY
jgi:peptidoglycan hydrolase-like protein with peptidoglycan-binding domain